MTRALEFEQKPSHSGDTKSLVVFLHGYGANGADLLGLSEPLAEHLPDTAFMAPDAPDRVPGAPFGYQWFPIPWIDGSSEQAAAEGMAAASDDLNAFLDIAMQSHGVTPAQTILFGFSQGTMMSLQVALRRAEAFAGIVAFSGRLINPEKLADEITAKPPVLLVHGDQDDVVPPSSLPEAGNALSEAGVDVFAHVMKGTAHGIAPDGLSVAVAFMRDKLGYQA